MFYSESPFFDVLFFTRLFFKRVVCWYYTALIYIPSTDENGSFSPT